MYKGKARFVICLVVCLSLVISQTLITLGSDNSVVPDSATPKFSKTEDEIIDKLTVDPVKGNDYNGYIVSVKEKEIDEILEDVKEDTIIKEASEGLVVVENPEDAAKFVSAGAIKSIEPNYEITSFAFPATAPNDPFFNSYHDYQWGLKKINTNASWKLKLRGKNINVAILDSGLNYNHEDIDESRVSGMNFYGSGSPTTNFIDNQGHGTFVTSIIAAKTNNGIGMSGITDEVNIISCKTTGSDGKGELVDLLQAYDYLLDSGTRIDVMNLSLGHAEFSPEENARVQQFIDKGTIVVAAVGNEGLLTGKNKNRINYPANYTNVIGVASIDKSGYLSAFSNRNESVDVAAPGENMMGIEYNSSYGYRSGGSGTSFASPVVASAAIIAKSIHPKMNAAGFLSALQASVTDVGVKGWDSSYGYGILELSSLTKYLKNGTGWEKINGKWCYFVNGAKVIGWKKISGKWYYFNSNGARLTGLKKIKKKSYYFNSKGVRQTGWQKIKKKKYYFNSKGVMQTGFKKIKKKNYYFSSKGVMQTGWKKIKKKWYYFTSKGIMLKGKQKIKGKRYRFNSKGVLISKRR